MADSLEDTARGLLAGWIGRWVGADAPSVGHLRLDDSPAMHRVAQRLVSCIVRDIVPLPKRYRDDHPAVAQLTTLDPSVDADGPAIRAALKEARLAGSSSIAALGYVDSLARASTPEKGLRVWKALFYEAGPLYMAVWRTSHDGAEQADIAAALARALRSLD